MQCQHKICAIVPGRIIRLFLHPGLCASSQMRVVPPVRKSPTGEEVDVGEHIVGLLQEVPQAQLPDVHGHLQIETKHISSVAVSFDNTCRECMILEQIHKSCQSQSAARLPLKDRTHVWCGQPSEWTAKRRHSKKRSQEGTFSFLSPPHSSRALAA